MRVRLDEVVTQSSCKQLVGKTHALILRLIVGIQNPFGAFAIVYGKGDKHIYCWGVLEALLDCLHPDQFVTRRSGVG